MAEEKIYKVRTVLNGRSLSILKRLGFIPDKKADVAKLALDSFEMFSDGERLSDLMLAIFDVENVTPDEALDYDTQKIIEGLNDFLFFAAGVLGVSAKSKKTS